VSRSLRVSVILFVSVANLLVFGAGFVWLTGSLSRHRRAQEEDFTSLLVERLQNLIDARSIQASGILRWTYWEQFEDAVVVHLPDPAETTPRSELAPSTPLLPISQTERAGMQSPYGSFPFTEFSLQREAQGAPVLPAAPAREEGGATGEEPPAATEAPSGAEGTADTEGAAAQVTEEGVPLAAGESSPAPRPKAAVPAVRQQGVILHPLGSVHRTSDFDWNGILEEIQRAVSEDGTRRTHGGSAVPIHDPLGRAWGGCWFKLRPSWTVGALVRQLLPWFVFSTFFLTLATFVVLQRLVLEPVELLARGSRRLAEGDWSVQLPEPARRDEIAELVRAFNRMAGEVRGSGERLAHEVEIATEKARRAEAAAMMQRRLAATGELAAGIAHEINNPLGGMVNAVEVLAREELDPGRRRRYLELLESGLERMRTTVGRVLRLAPRTSRVEPLSIAGPIGDAIGLMRHRISRDGVTLELESRGVRTTASESDPASFFAWLPPLRGSANELGQVALNLIANSLDAIASLPASERAGRGRIRLAIELEGRELHLCFEDDGPGMAAEDLARAPDPFFTTKESGRGTGLGLAIVHNVITSHGGRVLLASERGRFFRVDVYLPVYQREERPRA
jgi:signal transduction histidine kinase